MAKELPNRKDVDVNLTWNVFNIYKDIETMDQALADLRRIADEITEKYQNQLNTPEKIVECLNEYEKALIIADNTGQFVYLMVSADYTDAEAKQIKSRANMAVAESMTRLSFVETEILQQDEEVIKKAIALATNSKVFLTHLLEKKPHVLSKETEEVLATLSPILNMPYELYQTTKLADIVFPSFEVDGVTYPMSYSLFEDNYQYEENTAVRRKAFEVFSNKIREYQNTTAAEYNAKVTGDKLISKIRGYNSALEYMFTFQRVNNELFDRQIDLITQKLPPIMRKYARLIKRVYNLDEMTFADLKLPLDAEYTPKVTIEESLGYLEKGLAVMGEDYLDMIRTAFKDRWIDFAENKGKSTGGFCYTPYGCGSLILLQWHNRLSDLLTLAHELGHAGHFKAFNEKQSYYDTNYSTYITEAPSTLNELLMEHYLMSQNDEPRFRRWILATMIGKTYYHNFVTHLLEAAYQREVYRIIDAGGSVEANTLSRIKYQVLKDFWGDEVKLNEGAELTWMRQPHYYEGLWTYIYSAGLTVSTQMCKRILEEGQPAVDDWKKFMEAGSTLDPIDLVALAKIDITTDKPLLDTIEYLGKVVDELWELTDQLENK